MIFGEGFELVNSPDLQEPLEQWAVGEASAESAVIHSFEVTGDVCSQGEHATAIKGFGASAFVFVEVEFVVGETSQASS